jgi:SPP1 gp7 family putative phage head morphogenesis protein
VRSPKALRGGAGRRPSNLELTNEQLQLVVQTVATAAVNSARHDEAMHLGAKGLTIGMQHSAICDQLTTPLCRFLHGKGFRIDDAALKEFVPPLHDGCRSVLLPVVVGTEDVPWITTSELAEARRLAEGTEPVRCCLL